MNSLSNKKKPSECEPSLLNSAELFEIGRLVNHDLRAPIRHIQVFHNILVDAQEGEMSEEHQRCHQYVLDACARADQQIQSLADYFKLCAQVPVFEEVDLQALMESVKAEFCSSDIANCSFDVPQKVMSTDPNLLSLILYETLDNALKFHPGTDVNAAHQRRVRIYIQEVNGEAYLVVEDNGIGIEDRYKTQVCQVFRKLNAKEKYSGMGMGLARVDMAARKLDLSFCIQDAKPGVSFQLCIGKL